MIPFKLYLLIIILCMCSTACITKVVGKFQIPHALFKFIHVFNCTCIHVHIYLYTFTCLHIYIYKHAYIHTYIYSYVHTYIHSYVHTYVHTYLHTYIHTYVRYVRTYIRTYLRTYIRTYIHTYGTHQLQLKRDTRGTRKGNACYTRVFLVIYTQLHAMQITFVYRPTRVFTTYLRTRKGHFCTHTRMHVLELAQSTAKKI